MLYILRMLAFNGVCEERREQSYLRGNMKPELPGFYYDEEKNRYFPIKGPIPGSKASSSSKTKQKPDPKPVQETNYQKRTKLKALKLLYSRELNGNVIPVNKKMSNFEEEIQKTQASYPKVWKYESTTNIGDAALKQLQVDIQTSVGLTRKDIILAGSTEGYLSILRVSKPIQGLSDESETQTLNGGIECDPVSVLPHKENNAEERKAPHRLILTHERCYHALSAISSIQFIGRYDESENFHCVNKALVTTLGNTGHGSPFFFNLGEDTITGQKLRGNVTSGCTIWTAECNRSGSHAAFGTDLGAALVDLETGAGSYFLQSKSDVFALQFDQWGKIVQCGLRNGAIVSVDLRERPGRPFPRLTRHQIRYQSTTQTTKNKQWFELKGNINPSHVIYMPSSITCLKTLKTYDQYLMASSMDGTIKLYDQRMDKRGGSVQTYEGHVNSHTRIEFGIDPSERFLISGGVDFYTRVWSIKSGQLLSENKFSNSSLSAVCWSATERQRDRKDSIVHGAWLGSCEAIFNMD